MNDLEQLEARIKELEQQVVELPQKILSDFKKLIEMHSHEMGGSVIWKIPVEELKKAQERQAAASKPANKTTVVKDPITLKDEVVIKIETVEAE